MHHTVSGNCSAQQHAKSVSWLRRTEYISTEYNRLHAVAEGAETKCVLIVLPYNNALYVMLSCYRVGYSVKKKLQDTDIYKVRSLMANIHRLQVPLLLI